MEESGGKVFSDYDVDISGRTWFKGVKLIETSTAPAPVDPPVDPTPTPPAVPSASLDNRVFKIMLINNDQFFYKESGAEWRAAKWEPGAAEYKFIAAEEADTYYLQSVESPDEWVSFKKGGWFLRLKTDG